MELGIAITLLTTGALLLGGAAFRISTRFGLSPLLAGVVVVGFTTSFPEVVSTALAAEHGASTLAFAALLGSNTFNSLFILGIVVLLAHSKPQWREVRFDSWASLAVCTIPFAAVVASGVPASRHVLAVLCLCSLCAYTLRAAITARHDHLTLPTADLAGNVDHGVSGMSHRLPWIDFVVAVFGVLLLTLGSNGLVEQVLSQRTAAPDAVGSTLVAAATSLPELFVAIYAVARGWTAIAIGSVLGSNVFNMLGALGGVLLVAPLPGIEGHPLFDAGLMTISSGFAILILREQRSVSRWLAAAMISGWIAYAVARFFAG